jgi:hypothetical protein
MVEKVPILYHLYSANARKNKKPLRADASKKLSLVYILANSQSAHDF